MKNSDLFINENEYADLHSDDAIRHLQEAIRCRTVSYLDTSLICYEEFDRLHNVMRECFPLVFEKGEFELVDHSVLIRFEGSDSSLRPALFMSHQDVVPIVKGTEKDWLHDPFSGDLADGYIWGRGTLDIKNQVFATLEAVEYLLQHDYVFRRTVYLAFGQDEETIQTGAYAIGQLLKNRGVELEYLVDEGGGNVTDAAVYGAPGRLISSIALYEKGYADMKVSVESKGGHSSRPFYGTSLGNLSKAITSIVEHPLDPVMPEVCLKALEILTPYISEEPMKTYVSDPEKYMNELTAYWLSRPELFNQIVTTIAPTMISGGSEAGNVMPQNMDAVINFRLAPQDSLDSLMEHCRSLVDEQVKLEYINANEASIPSDADSYGYCMMSEVMSHYYRDLLFVPSVSTGGTDARNYECICRCCMRRGPFMEESEITGSGVHGTNERISVRAYLQGIRVLIRMISETC